MLSKLLSVRNPVRVAIAEQKVNRVGFEPTLFRTTVFKGGKLYICLNVAPYYEQVNLPHTEFLNSSKTYTTRPPVHNFEFYYLSIYCSIIIGNVSTSLLIVVYENWALG